MAPSTGLQVPPPSVEICHCTVGAGNPEAVASKTALWPSSTVTLSGCLVTAGAFCTVSVAASLLASPSVFLKVARYSWPLRDAFTATIVSELDVAPATFVQVLPPLEEVSHLTVGAGEPDAAASNTAFWPSSTVTLCGCSVTVGDFCTVSVAALLVASPAVFLYTARSWSPVSDVFALAIVSVPALAPSIGVHDPPPLLETSHWTLGVGTPEAVELNAAAWPSSTVTLSGCLVTFGALLVSAAILAPQGSQRARSGRAAGDQHEWQQAS